MAAPLLAEPSGASSGRSLNTNGWVADYVVSGPPRPFDIAKLSYPLEHDIEADFAGAQSVLEGTAEEILLAALARSVARTVGSGVLVVEVAGGHAGSRTVSLPCDSRRGVTGQELLASSRRALAGADRLLGRVDVCFASGSTVAGPGQHPGYRLALQVHQTSDAVQLDWCYDTRSFDENTVRELAEQYPFALIEVMSG